MTITPTFLTRAAGLSAVAAGLLFIGVQVGHPYLDATTVTTRRLHGARGRQDADGRPVARRHHRDVPAPDRQTGALGLIGYVALRRRVSRRPERAGRSALPSCRPSPPRSRVMSTTSDRRHRRHARPATSGGSRPSTRSAASPSCSAASSSGSPCSAPVFWPAGRPPSSRVGAVATVLRAVLPGVNFRLFAIPIGVAMIGLGWSLWREQRSAAAGRADDQVTSPRDRAGAR